MAKMRKIQPRLKELQERYAEDRQKFNTEMMAMYKREKVNPLGRLFADHGADSGIYLAVLGADRNRGIASGRFHACGFRTCRPKTHSICCRLSTASP